MRDLVWMSLCNGNPGVFFWNARGSEVREFKPAREAMDENLPEMFKGKIPMLPSGVPGADAAILGAGALIWSELRQQGHPSGRPAPGGNA